jgi:hypothetical protein
MQKISLCFFSVFARMPLIIPAYYSIEHFFYQGKEICLSKSLFAQTKEWPGNCQCT